MLFTLRNETEKDLKKAESDHRPENNAGTGEGRSTALPAPLPLPHTHTTHCRHFYPFAKESTIRARTTEQSPLPLAPPPQKKAPLTSKELEGGGGNVIKVLQHIDTHTHRID